MSHADDIAALYDHEREQALDGGHRRRRRAHDWGADDLFATAERRVPTGHAAALALAERDEPARHPADDPLAHLADAIDDRFDDDRRADDWLAATDDRRAEDRFDLAERFADDLRDDRRVDDWLAGTPAGRDDDRFDDGGDRAAAPRADRAPTGGRRRRPVADWLQEEERAVRGPAGRHPLDDLDLLAGSDADPRDRAAAAAAVSPTAPTLELELPPGVATRRTVTVTGHPDAARRTERALATRDRRPGRSLDDRIGHRPDHIAAYAFALGVLLILIAVLTAGH